MITPKVTLVTGASSGIGRGVAIRLSGQRRLLLQGRDPCRLAETRSACERPGEHALWICDFNSAAVVERSLEPFFREPGFGIDCLVHCAGMITVLPIRSIGLTKAREVLEVNFLSAVEITRLLVRKRLNGQNLKRIIYISSIAGKFGAKGFSLYSASKGALDAMMRSLAVELAPSVTVNSILPGTVRTAMTQSMLDDQHISTSLEKSSPLGNGTPSDIASTVEFLASDGARWITGQQFVVDGGRSVNISA